MGASFFGSLSLLQDYRGRCGFTYGFTYGFTLFIAGDFLGGALVVQGQGGVWSGGVFRGCFFCEGVGDDGGMGRAWVWWEMSVGR